MMLRPFFSEWKLSVMKILALSGSLRSASINSALLRAASRLAPPEIAITLFDGLGDLPLFNPDREASPPGVVTYFRSQVADADALLIASPEYAHGVTGTVKNALDWLVSFEPFADKSVAVLNASPRAHHADAALREILRTMAAVIVEPASIIVPLLGTKLDEEGMVSTPSVVASIQDALAALYQAVAMQRGSRNASFPL
jgi:chromate reductase